jgi:hypothetical protein
MPTSMPVPGAITRHLDDEAREVAVSHADDQADN